MRLLPKNPTFIADLRLCVNYPANSSTAVSAAIQKYGLTRVLLDCVFSNPEDDSDSPALYFCPKLSANYSGLERMSIGRWYDDEDNRMNFPEIDTIPEIQIVPGVTEFWIYFDFDPSLYPLAIETLWLSSFKDKRFVLVAPHALPPHEFYKRADPTGTADYILTDGGILSLLKNRKASDRTFAFGCDSEAAFKTVTVV